MTEPGRLFDPVTDEQAAGYRQRIDASLVAIEQRDLLPEFAWAMLNDTLAQLTAEPGLLPIAAAYLRTVERRGAKMFSQATRHLGPGYDTGDRVECSCGRLAVVLYRRVEVGLEQREGRCDACGRSTAEVRRMLDAGAVPV